MIINESRTVSLGDGKSAYQYGGKYYIKSDDTKKEISKDQYDKLLSKDAETGSTDSSSSTKKRPTVRERFDKLADNLGIELGPKTPDNDVFYTGVGEIGHQISMEDAQKACKELSKYPTTFSSGKNTITDDLVYANFLVPNVGMVDIFGKKGDEYCKISLRNLTKTEKKDGLTF